MTAETGVVVRTNPFSVRSPEDTPAQDVMDLFVDVFTDFHKITEKGHTFLNGPRGSGKSMMFRAMQPDVMSIRDRVAIKDLDFLSIYVPIKNAEWQLTEFARLEKVHADTFFNEHYMVAYIASRTFLDISKLFTTIEREPDEEELNNFTADILTLLTKSGYKGNLDRNIDKGGGRTVFVCLKDICDELYREVKHYLRGLAFKATPEPYDGTMLDYSGFLMPLADRLKGLSFLPNKPLYIMLDDADNMNLTQTKIMNSWLSSRTTSNISLKISTQLNYKTYKTVNRTRIETPHDYSEINIASVYTSSKDKYKDRVREIVVKRLKKAEIEKTPEEFFPPDIAQENAIEKIKQEYRGKYKKEDWKGKSISDDANRYARPDFIKGLKGPSKSGSTYSYAGFNQLVHISSGIIRFFLDPAAQMYATQMSRNSSAGKVEFIETSIQNTIISRDSDEFIFEEFDKIIKDITSETDEELSLLEPLLEKENHLDCIKLRNLIHALGGTFHKVLISDRTERRVFSIAISGALNPENQKILDLGVRYGYFHKSTIGNKAGTGRTLLYILSRRLAPFYKLDPTSFAGYLFVVQDKLKAAMENPAKLIREFKADDENAGMESEQLPLL
jgi:hypothetical protein